MWPTDRELDLIYGDMLEAIRIYGEKHGFDLVLKIHKSPPRRLDAQAHLRDNSVLFAGKSVDITPESASPLRKASTAAA